MSIASKSFYSKLGWRLDADFAVGDHFRVVQFTPPGSPASIHFGKGASSAAPGSAQGLFLVVSDIEGSRAELVSRGVDVGEIFHVAGLGQPHISGRDPERRSYFSYAAFKDPDGNSWLLQEVTARFPGRVNATRRHSHRQPTWRAHFAAPVPRTASTRNGSAGDMMQTWPDWYAEYMVAEQAGKTLPQ